MSALLIVAFAVIMDIRYVASEHTKRLFSFVEEGMFSSSGTLLYLTGISQVLGVARSIPQRNPRREDH